MLEKRAILLRAGTFPLGGYRLKDLRCNLTVCPNAGHIYFIFYSAFQVCIVLYVCVLFQCRMFFKFVGLKITYTYILTLDDPFF